MAIYHLHTEPISRNKGHSAVAAAAYRAREVFRDERTGEQHDFSQKNSDLVHAEILAPENSPAWVRDRETLWNKVEAAENRKDARPAREVRTALPVELSLEQNKALVRDFCQKEFVARGMIADACIHFDPKKGNPHVHIQLTTRDIGPEGFGKKNRDWNKRETLNAWRAAWAEHVNKALERHGHAARIDHRTLEEQGITNRVPTIHMGKSPSPMWKERQSDIQEYNQLSADAQKLEAELQAREEKIAKQKARQEAAAKPRDWRALLKRDQLFLEVPYQHGKEARSHGARYDRDSKRYVLHARDLAKIESLIRVEDRQRIQKQLEAMERKRQQREFERQARLPFEVKAKAKRKLQQIIENVFGSEIGTIMRGAQTALRILNAVMDAREAQRQAAFAEALLIKQRELKARHETLREEFKPLDQRYDAMMKLKFENVSFLETKLSETQRKLTETERNIAYIAKAPSRLKEYEASGRPLDAKAAQFRSEITDLETRIANALALHAQYPKEFRDQLKAQWKDMNAQGKKSLARLRRFEKNLRAKASRTSWIIDKNEMSPEAAARAFGWKYYLAECVKELGKDFGTRDTGREQGRGR